MITVFIIFTVLITILTATIFISVKLEYDILSNVGKIKIKLFRFLVIFSSGITISDSYLNLNKKKNKVIKIKIDLNDEKLQFFQDLDSYLKHKIYPVNINLSVLFCSTNPFFACVMGGTLNAITGVILANLIKNKTDVKVINNVETGFRQNALKFELYLSLVFSLYDYFWAYLKAYKMGVRRKREKAAAKQHQ